MSKPSVATNTFKINNKDFTIVGGVLQEFKKEKKYKGKKNKTAFPFIVKLLKMSQKEMKAFLEDELCKYYEEVINGDGYLYAKGTLPVCLTAHMDTTPTIGGNPREKVKDFYEEETKLEDGTTTHTLTSPQGIGGDDRCGIWCIINILHTTDLRPTVVFCEDEEIGCVGSEKFMMSEFIDDLSEMKFLVEIDRRGSSDMVFYNDANEEFHKFVGEVTGYNERIGSCSDICNLSAGSGVSSVNLSSGYYDEHTVDESIVIEEMRNTKDKVILLLEEAKKEETPQYEYKLKPEYSGYYGRYSYGGRFYDDYDWDDWDNEDYLPKEYESFAEDERIPLTSNNDLNVVGYITFENGEGKVVCAQVEAESKFGVFGKFFIEHPDVCFDYIMDYCFE